MLEDEKGVPQQVIDTLPQTGELRWIGLSPGRKKPIFEVSEVLAEVGTGLQGDCHARRGTSKRQVTLIQEEHLPIIQHLAGLSELHPATLRRNLVVRGVNLLGFRGRRFYVGDVLLEHSGPCDPCNRMEENLGPGGYNAMRGHGGILARVIEPGTLRIGDVVRLA